MPTSVTKSVGIPSLVAFVALSVNAWAQTPLGKSPLIIARQVDISNASAQRLTLPAGLENALPSEVLLRLSASELSGGIGIDNLRIFANADEITDKFRQQLNSRLMESRENWEPDYYKQVEVDLRSSFPPEIAENGLASLRRLGVEAQMLDKPPVYTGPFGRFGLWRYLGRSINLPQIHLQDLLVSVRSRSKTADFLRFVTIPSSFLDNCSRPSTIVRKGSIHLDAELLFPNPLELELSGALAELKDARAELKMVKDSVSETKSELETWKNHENKGRCNLLDFDVNENDAAPAIVKACEVLKDGGVLFVPTGTYTINSTIQVPNDVCICGAGRSTIFNQKHSHKGPLFQLRAGCELRNCQFKQEHPAFTNPPENLNRAWRPFEDYDFQVEVQNGPVTMDNVLFLNPLKGIRVGVNGESVGQVLITNVRGQPLLTGISIETALDVVQISHIHFWVFWSDREPLAYTKANGIGIRLFRVDNPLFSQLFMYGYSTGVEISRGNDGQTTSKAKFAQCDFDLCAQGFRIEAPTTSLSICQFSYQGHGEPVGGQPAAILVRDQNAEGSVSQMFARGPGIVGSNGNITEVDRQR